MATKEKPEAAGLIDRIHREAETADNSPRAYQRHEVGDEIRQGDVHLFAIREVPKGLKLTAQRQLAPGTSKGSRHVIEGDVKVYESKAGDALQGPFLLVGPEGATVTHPEHAHFTLPAGAYDVRYQRDLALEERQRVAD